MKSISEIKELLALSKNPGNISPELMAFFFYLKEMKRRERRGDEDFNAFAMSTDDLEWLAELVKQMITYAAKNLRFQIGISKWDGSEQLNHWSFLEFNFNFNDETLPTLDILICDPLGFNQALVLTNLLSSRIGFGKLSTMCTLKIYIPIDTLQVKGRVCAYFTTDNISMLSNQEDYCPIYDYMNSHQHERKKQEAIETLSKFRESFTNCYTNEELNEIYNFNIVVAPLPVRLLRTKHSVSDLEYEVRDSEEHRGVVVNNKGEAAWSSIRKNLFFAEDSAGSEQQRNMRVNKKMEKLDGEIREVSSSISSLEDARVISEGIQRHLLLGLEQIIEQSVKKTGYNLFNTQVD
ncbi:TPA: hypothetical protein ACTUT5_000944 [Legionella anisa]|uniref:Uncharacterized protein n=1 Tax=Legionella anisa TaxID=28082 RepID=A0AAX0WXR9_9GAMM|nr:hypothetical protein [Legionella anisa]AWN75824.1 hypothetical protein DLD14_13650 [Legionella anisa]MBN5936406.1 hypothetical protein [Legionella anisa]MCW8425073.1 hypothetical protein [Legionella anisa]MCW8445811.1 hypothetical protein [Legionella anisa]PNL63467.1 hypothetical protein A6J39_008820 [Legionella anisa]